METNGINVGNQTLTQKGWATYSEVTLTEEETQEALRQARKQKYFAVKEKEYFQNIAKEPEKITMDKAELLDFIANKAPEFDSLLQEKQVGELLDYFTGNSEKGLMLHGGVGSGKTYLMGLFSCNPKASYGVVSCREVSSLFTKEGYESIRAFYYISRGYKNYFSQTDYGKCFDDLGEEKNKKYFGNELNVMEEIIESRYNNKKLWQYTHITTNLNVDQIEEIYGKRVRSRMREMFQLIEFKGVTDLRK